MDAKKGLITGIFNTSRKLEIPFYQRAYVWGKEQWERLLADLEFVSEVNQPYFLGSVILKDKRISTFDSDGFVDNKVIIDGQQRLTTLVLFFKALYLKRNTNKDFDYMFRHKGDKSVFYSGYNDQIAFEKVINSTEPVFIKDDNSKIVCAFNYFLENIDINKINDACILSNIQFVCIDIDENEDEQKIFDTINSLGVRLTTAELLKNYFFGKADIERYKNTWVETFEKDDETREYWDTICSSGSKKRPMIDMFFDSYFQLFVENPKYEVTSEDKKKYERIDTLFSSYKSFIEKYCVNNKEVILKDLFDYAGIFKELFDPAYLDEAIPSTYGKERLNVIIFGLNNTTVIPYILYFYTVNKDDKERQEMFRILESFIMKRIVCGGTTKNYNRLFMSFVRNEIDTPTKLKKELTKVNDLSTSLPSNSELQEGFISNKNLNNTTAKGVIYLIESSLEKDGAAISIKGFNSYSLEHLLPKKWRNHWGQLPIDLAEKRDSVLKTLGNLAIITQKLNTSITDSDWDTKIKGKNKNFGLQTYAKGLATMENVLTQIEWNEEKILERAEWLYNVSLNVWDLEQELLSEDYKEEASDVDEIDLYDKQMSKEDFFKALKKKVD